MVIRVEIRRFVDFVTVVYWFVNLKRVTRLFYVSYKFEKYRYTNQNVSNKQKKNGFIL